MTQQILEILQSYRSLPYSTENIQLIAIDIDALKPGFYEYMRNKHWGN